MKKSLAVLFLIAVSLVAYAHYQSIPSATDADAVRAADTALAKAVESKSVEQTMAFYAPDAVTTGSAMPASRGVKDIRNGWATAFAEQGFALTWKAEQVVVTDNGSIAYSSGTWSFGGKPQGPYLTVWQKQPSGQWKVIIDAVWKMP